MKHVMLDLETWGLRPGSALRSIGACYFHPGSWEIGERYYVNVSKDSCLEARLTVQKSTEDWWARQAPAAQAALLVDPVPLLEALQGLTMFFHTKGGVYLWAQGAGFDPGMIEPAYAAVGMQSPWQFYDVRDTRTMYHMARLDTSTVKRAGTYHHALDDALHQAYCVQLASSMIWPDAFKGLTCPTCEAPEVCTKNKYCGIAGADL